MDLVKKWIASVSGSKTVDAKEAAKAAGNAKASNVVMVGAACKNLPVSKDSLEQALSQLFSSKGEAVVKANIEALKKGAEA
jgi:indolepyruvate ferredoxin oxidoreductase beta subunit